mmetsp:Transcript_410/g.1355  ORF Transcript_410/g.1355 Transcript_410/m.1355 type:complete len:441 (-) Transcript_410:675-1997(-)
MVPEVTGGFVHVVQGQRHEGVLRHTVRLLRRHHGVSAGHGLHHRRQLIRIGQGTALGCELRGVRQERLDVATHLILRDTIVGDGAQLLQGSGEGSFPSSRIAHHVQRADRAGLPTGVKHVELNVSEERLLPRENIEADLQRSEGHPGGEGPLEVGEGSDRNNGTLGEEVERHGRKHLVAEDTHHTSLAGELLQLDLTLLSSLVQSLLVHLGQSRLLLLDHMLQRDLRRAIQFAPRPSMKDGREMPALDLECGRRGLGFVCAPSRPGRGSGTRIGVTVTPRVAAAEVLSRAEPHLSHEVAHLTALFGLTARRSVTNPAWGHFADDVLQLHQHLVRRQVAHNIDDGVLWAVVGAMVLFDVVNGPCLDEVLETNGEPTCEGVFGVERLKNSAFDAVLDGVHHAHLGKHRRALLLQAALLEAGLKDFGEGGEGAVKHGEGVHGI